MSWRDTTSKLWQKLCNRKEADCLKSEMKVILNRITGQSQGSIKRFTREIEFAHEVRSFFYNILLENDSDSERYQSSRTLSEAFEKSWASIASDSEDNDKMKPPSIDEVKKWISKCRLLSPVQLAQVIHELDETCPNCLIKSEESNEVEVNTDLIDRNAFQLTSQIISTHLDMPSKDKKKSK